MDKTTPKTVVGRKRGRKRGKKKKNKLQVRYKNPEKREFELGVQRRKLKKQKLLKTQEEQNTSPALSLLKEVTEESSSAQSSSSTLSSDTEHARSIARALDIVRGQSSGSDSRQDPLPSISSSSSGEESGVSDNDDEGDTNCEELQANVSSSPVLLPQSTATTITTTSLTSSSPSQPSSSTSNGSYVNLGGVWVKESVFLQPGFVPPTVFAPSFTDLQAKMKRRLKSGAHNRIKIRVYPDAGVSMVLVTYVGKQYEIVINNDDMLIPYVRNMARFFVDYDASGNKTYRVTFTAFSDVMLFFHFIAKFVWDETLFHIAL